MSTFEDYDLLVVECYPGINMREVGCELQGDVYCKRFGRSGLSLGPNLGCPRSVIYAVNHKLRYTNTSRFSIKKFIAHFKRSRIILSEGFRF